MEHPNRPQRPKKNFVLLMHRMFAIIIMCLSGYAAGTLRGTEHASLAQVAVIVMALVMFIVTERSVQMDLETATGFTDESENIQEVVEAQCEAVDDSETPSEKDA